MLKSKAEKEYKKLKISLNKTLGLCTSLFELIKKQDIINNELQNKNLFHLNAILQQLAECQLRMNSIKVDPVIIDAYTNDNIIDINDFYLSKQLSEDDTIFVDLNQSLNVFLHKDNFTPGNLILLRQFLHLDQNNNL